ncbi:DUF2273 domain-containing protein [Gorillibacterium sp. sgz5001074]|uniref:DUF2273 domain-containing protein n=1 Tax=Gorillibacterium sp. sgz5001074 TaxID=3446695 RepID=UPI003F666030
MWMELWENHKGKILGTAFGFFLGLLYLTVGFWDMLIFAFIVFIGYYMGKKRDQGERLVHIEVLWRWLSERWRMFR